MVPNASKLHFSEEPAEMQIFQIHSNPWESQLVRYAGGDRHNGRRLKSDADLAL
ncbi:hypothetical protein SAMN05443244_3276 [Terriglobus roseus]|uniref:Uncharacterized protein n=1 Tax=Terriglobus roseus TaxID=392734 RepID=A0A1H4RWJ8_9BACT|nr:hypothetical protein SAMN05443244_3276 [Terriglobus roseus]